MIAIAAMASARVNARLFIHWTPAVLETELFRAGGPQGDLDRKRLAPVLDEIDLGAERDGVSDADFLARRGLFAGSVRAARRFAGRDVEGRGFRGAAVRFDRLGAELVLGHADDHLVE